MCPFCSKLCCGGCIKVIKLILITFRNGLWSRDSRARIVGRICELINLWTVDLLRRWLLPLIPFNLKTTLFLDQKRKYVSCMIQPWTTIATPVRKPFAVIAPCLVKNTNPINSNVFKLSTRDMSSPSKWNQVVCSRDFRNWVNTCGRRSQQLNESQRRRKKRARSLSFSLRGLRVNWINSSKPSYSLYCSTKALWLMRSSLWKHSTPNLTSKRRYNITIFRDLSSQP